MNAPAKGETALHAYRAGFSAGWLGLEPDCAFDADSASADAYAVGYRVGKRESLRYAPKFGAQSMRKEP